MDGVIFSMSELNDGVNPASLPPLALAEPVAMLPLLGTCFYIPVTGGKGSDRPSGDFMGRTAH